LSPPEAISQPKIHANALADLAGGAYSALTVELGGGVMEGRLGIEEREE